MTLIDTHVHIDFYPDPHLIAREYESLQIYTLFVTNLPEVFEKHYNIFQNYKYVRLCLGYHPQVASEYKFNYELFNRLSKQTRYIGEVGLDFQDEHKDIKKRQLKVFEYITAPNFNKGRIYSIHSKNTEDSILDILVQNNVKHAILHWYTGKLTTLDKLVNKGYYFSLNPKMLTTKNGFKIINRIPPNRILFETDGPFSKFNRKVIKPNDIHDIYDLFEESIPNFQELVFRNFKRLLIEKDISNYK